MSKVWEMENMGVTVNSVIEDRLVFNFWTFETVLLYSSCYYIKVPVLTVFWVFYSKKSFIQMSHLLPSLRYLSPGRRTYYWVRHCKVHHSNFTILILRLLSENRRRSLENSWTLW